MKQIYKFRCRSQNFKCKQIPYFSTNRIKTTIRQHPKKLLIVTEWRSGSTMFENVFTSVAGSFHMHEPLMTLSFMKRIVSVKNKNYQKAIKLVKSLFQCDFRVFKSICNFVFLYNIYSNSLVLVFLLHMCLCTT